MSKLQTIYKEYGGMWVVLDEEGTEIISVGKTEQKAYEEAVKSGYKNPEPTHVPNPIPEKEYIGEFLALHPETNEIIAHGKDLAQVAEEAERKGITNPIFHGVPEERVHHIELV